MNEIGPCRGSNADRTRRPTVSSTTGEACRPNLPTRPILTLRYAKDTPTEHDHRKALTRALDKVRQREDETS